MRNFSPGEQVSLHFEGVLADNRLGVNIPIKTEPIVLSCSDKSQNMYSLGIGDDMIIQYNPFKDKLFLYEYKTSHGLQTASSSAQTAATDENAYNRVIPVSLYSGDKVITTGYNIKLFRVNTATSFTELTAGEDEVIAIAPTQITLDLRLIHKSDYVIRAYAENREVAMVQFSVNRLNPRYTIRMTNGTDISPFDTMRYDEVMVDYDGNVVDCPGSLIRILWYADTYAKTNVLLNEGDVTQFLLSLTGIGSSYNDSWIELHTMSELKEAHCIATFIVDKSKCIILVAHYAIQFISTFFKCTGNTNRVHQFLFIDTHHIPITYMGFNLESVVNGLCFVCNYVIHQLKIKSLPFSSVKMSLFSSVAMQCASLSSDIVCSSIHESL